MRIVFIASEMTPLCKTGGLGDVIGSLPSAIAASGHQVEVFLPYYEQFFPQETLLAEERKDMRVRLSSYYRYGDMLSCPDMEDVSVFTLASPYFFGRDGLYHHQTGGDFADNAERFLFFCKGVLQYLQGRGETVDIVHCHDWQTGMIPLLLEKQYRSDSVFTKTKTVFTIHNLAYQGVFSSFDFRLTNLDHSDFHQGTVEFWGQFNMMKGGINGADHITTVSPHYAEEIQTEKFGCGLEGVLQENKGKLTGILNGIDTEEWNPQRDNYLAKTYSVRKMAGKEECKKDLRSAVSLPAAEKDVPLFGFVGRFVEQKGLDILLEALPEMLNLPLQLVILGSGEAVYERAFCEMAAKMPHKIAVITGFHNALAHKIEAGADFFLMPSRFEPCGLNQLYSLRYGTVPVVHAVGGLKDTVRHYKEKEGNGIVFNTYCADALFQAVTEALELYENVKEYRKTRKRGMEEDFSWSRSAVQYENLYEELLKEDTRC